MFKLCNKWRKIFIRIRKIKNVAINIAIYHNKKVVILRYKFFDKNFEEEFLKNVKKYERKVYKITLNKYDEKSFYCSKYIWFLFYKTSKKTGHKLDFKMKKKYIIFPYDLLEFEEFDFILLDKKN